MLHFYLNPEAFDTDAQELRELMDELTSDQVREERAVELREWASQVESIDEDLAERLNLCADVNPISESAIDLVGDALELLAESEVPKNPVRYEESPYYLTVM